MKPTIRDTATHGLSTRLDALPTAPRQARHFITHTLRSWLLPADHIDTVVLLVSELVTNAVKATGRATGPHEAGPHETIAIIHLWARHINGLTTIAVGDNNPTPPIPLTPTPDQENGRGLYLVTSLAKDWGNYPTAQGKITWAQIKKAA